MAGHQTMLINEYRLSPIEPDARKFLETEMEKFFFRRGLGRTAGIRPAERLVAQQELHAEPLLGIGPDLADRETRNSRHRGEASSVYLCEYSVRIASPSSRRIVVAAKVNGLLPRAHQLYDDATFVRVVGGAVTK